MDQTVNIPFNIRLEPGDSSFKIDVDRKYTDDPNRLFGFSTVTLIPDFYNQQAFKLDMDSKEELEANISHDFQIELNTDQQTYDRKKYNAPTVPRTIPAMVKYLNQHFLNNQPIGAKYPPAVIDWVHLLTLNLSPEDRNSYLVEHAMALYGEPFNGTRHVKALPQAYGDIFYLNHLAFPTNPNVYQNIRIRINITAGISLAFSNDTLLKGLGYSAVQIPDTPKHRLDNPFFAFETFIAAKKAATEAAVYNTIVHAYPAVPRLTSDTFTFVTTKERERKPDNMAEDYSKILKEAGEKLNISLSIEHDAANKKFKIVYPAEEGFKVNLKVTPYIANKLGYGHITYITRDMVNAPYQLDIQFKDVEKVSRVQTFDTGMVVISLDQIGSQQTSQFTNTFMALLESDFGGYMTTRMGIDWPRVAVSPFNSILEFVISRFSETNQPIPLGWKGGAYIRGLLTGKV